MIKLSIEEIDNDNDYGSSVLEQDPEVKEPPLYQVILLNDDYTPMEFVVYVLQTVFNHTHEQSTQIITQPRQLGPVVCPKIEHRFQSSDIYLSR